MLEKITIEGCIYFETDEKNLIFKLDTKDVNVLGYEHVNHHADAFYDPNLVINNFPVSIFYTSLREEFFEECLLVLAIYKKVSDQDPCIKAFKKNPYIHSLLIVKQHEKTDNSSKGLP